MSTQLHEHGAGISVYGYNAHGHASSLVKIYYSDDNATSIEMIAMGHGDDHIHLYPDEAIQLANKLTAMANVVRSNKGTT